MASFISRVYATIGADAVKQKCFDRLVLINILVMNTANLSIIICGLTSKPTNSNFAQPVTIVDQYSLQLPEMRTKLQ